jgi:hypothetical protein
MPNDERTERTEEQIRTEIAAQREELVVAVAGLREGIAAKQRTAVGVAVAVPLAIASLLVVRRLWRG